MSVEGLGRVVMVIPTYNESENLEWIVGRLRTAQPGVDVMVVDDNSPDGTGDLADELAAADPAITVVHRTEKAGLGAAYLNGFAVALEAGYDVICTGCSMRCTPPTWSSARATCPAGRWSTGPSSGCCSRAVATSTSACCSASLSRMRPRGSDSSGAARSRRSTLDR